MNLDVLVKQLQKNPSIKSVVKNLERADARSRGEAVQRSKAFWSYKEMDMLSLKTKMDMLGINYDAVMTNIQGT